MALGPAELVRLEREHGSLEAAAEALPKHRDELAAAAANVRRIAEQVAAAVPELEPGARPPEPPPARIARQAVLDLAAGEPLEPLAEILARAEHAGAEPPGPGRRRVRIPTSVFWLVVEQRLKRGAEASARALSEQTQRSRKWPFVGRALVGELVKWVDANPEQARRALDRHEIPPVFRATRDGVLVPRA